MSPGCQDYFLQHLPVENVLASMKSYCKYAQSLRKRRHTATGRTSAHEKRPGQTSPVFAFPMDLMVWNHIPQQRAGAGAQQVGAAGAQHDTGAQQGSGAGQHGSQLWRRKHFLNIPENSPPRGLLHGSQHGSGSQHTGAGAQHVGVGAQHGSGCGQHGSQQDDLGLKQPKRPASAD